MSRITLDVTRNRQHETSGVWESVLARAPARHTRALGATCHALAELRRGEQPASALSAMMTLIYRRHFGPLERLTLAVAAVEALEPEHQGEIAFCLDPWPFDGDDPFRERSRQRCAAAFLELPRHDRREFLTMARGLA